MFISEQCLPASMRFLSFLAFFLLWTENQLSGYQAAVAAPPGCGVRGLTWRKCRRFGMTRGATIQVSNSNNEIFAFVLIGNGEFRYQISQKIFYYSLV